MIQTLTLYWLTRLEITLTSAIKGLMSSFYNFGGFVPHNIHVNKLIKYINFFNILYTYVLMNNTLYSFQGLKVKYKLVEPCTELSLIGHVEGITFSFV